VFVLPVTLIWYRTAHHGRVDFVTNILRTTLTVSATTCFFFAITEIPLATAFGGYFLGPVLASPLSVLLLREPLTRLRLGAAGLGLVGAYLIVRPGVELSLGALLAVLSGVLFSGYLIATRMAAATTPPLDALQFQAVFGTLLLTPFAISHWSWPTPAEMLLVGVMGGISAICTFMVIAAFRRSDASILSPLAYFELVTATLLGQLAFSELPDWLTFAGIATIVMSRLLVGVAARGGSTRPTRRVHGQDSAT
jgi:drug/metabolite transporter (DMT)-like permease